MGVIDQTTQTYTDAQGNTRDAKSGAIVSVSGSQFVQSPGGTQIGVTKPKETPYISSQDAAKTVTNQQTNLNAYSPSTAPNYQAPAPAPTTSQPTASPSKPDYVKLINPSTEQEQTYYNPDLNKSTIQGLTKSGWEVADSQLSNGFDFGTNKTAAVSPEQQAVNDAEEAIKKASADYEALKSTDSPQTTALIASIQSRYKALVDAMKDNNNRQEQSYQTLGYRIGGQYNAGGNSIKDIVNLAASQGVMRIQELQAQEQQEIANARIAEQNQEWTQFSQNMNRLEEVRKEKQDALNEQNKVAAQALAKVQEESRQLGEQQAISQAIEGGATSAQDVFKVLGGKVSTDTIKKAFDLWAADVADQRKVKAAALDNEQKKQAEERKNITDIQKSIAKNGAPPEVQAKIAEIMSNGGSASDAIAAAGDWLQEGSGMVGEYLFYKRQGGKASFDAYQNADANRKLRVAAAAANPDRVLSPTEAQALNVPYGTTSSQAYGKMATKPPTENQSKDASFAERTSQANEVLKSLENDITGMNSYSFAAQTFAEPSAVGNTLVSDTVRQQRQAERNFLNSILRRESGAVISPSEFAEGAKQYFPRPGDDAKTLAQKAQNRQTQINNLIRSAGHAYADIGEPSTADTMKQNSQQATDKVKQAYATHSTEIEKLINQNPNISDEDILQVLGI